MSNILKFPKKHKWEPTGYRINLYTEEDIYIVLLCLNLTDDLDDPKKWVRQDLRTELRTPDETPRPGRSETAVV